MRKKTVNVLQYIFFLGIGVFLLWLSAHNLSPENKQHLMDALTHADYWLIVPVMIMLLISHYSRALRWRLLIRPLGFNPSVRYTFIATLLGYFFNLLFPRLGEVMKCTILAKYEKIPADKLIGTMITERVCDFICLLLIILFTVLIQFDDIHQYASVQFNSILFDANGSLKIYKLLLLLAITAATIGVIIWLAKRFSSSSFIQTIQKLLKGVWQGIGSVGRMKNKWIFLFHTVLIWTLYLMSIRVGLYTMEAVSHLGLKACFAILSFGSIAMLATQGGIGAYQYTIQKLLPLYGVSEGPALGFGWMLWITQTGIIIITGIVCLILLPIIKKNKYEASGINAE